jgi:hypothetical protein
VLDRVRNTINKETKEGIKKQRNKERKKPKKKKEIKKDRSRHEKDKNKISEEIEGLNCNADMFVIH